MAKVGDFYREKDTDAVFVVVKELYNKILLRILYFYESNEIGNIINAPKNFFENNNDYEKL